MQLNTFKKEFSRIRDRLWELEKYIDLENFNKRIPEVNSLMNDLLLLAKRYEEFNIEKSAREYKKSPSKTSFVFTFFLVGYMFKKRGWELGILKKYLDHAIYGGKKERELWQQISDCCNEMNLKKMDVYSKLKELKKRGLINCIIL